MHDLLVFCEKLSHDGIMDDFDPETSTVADVVFGAITRTPARLEETWLGEVVLGETRLYSDHALAAGS